MQEAVMVFVAALIMIGYLLIGVAFVLYGVVKGVFRKAFNGPPFENFGRLDRLAFMIQVALLWPIILFGHYIFDSDGNPC